MKRVQIFTLAMIVALNIFATEETPVQTQPKHITVYPNAAEITRSAKFTLIPGRQVIVFDSLSPNLLSNSIQVQGKGSFIILDVAYRIKQPNPLNPNNEPLPAKIQKEIKLLEDSIRLKSYTVQDFQNQLEVLQTEKNLLLNNQLIRGNGGDTIPELRQTMEFFRSKLNNINSEILRITREMYPHSSVLQRMNLRLNELRAYNQSQIAMPIRQAVPQVVVSIIAETAGSGNIEISYLVSNAGWYASYDIRTSDDEEIQLIYKANVYQSSGISWNKVPLTLSTLDPQQQFNKPILPTWYLAYTPVYNTQLASKEERRPSREAQEEMIQLDNTGASGYSYQYTQAISSMLNIEYQINLDFSIPSDGQYHTVPIQNKKLGSDFKYYAAPKLDPKAYLIAQITDWQKMDLIQGQANIYFNGRYTGQTTIYPNTSKDSMELILGRTNNIIIERKQLDNDEKPQIVGSFITQTLSYQITIRNNNQRSIELELEDMIPYASDKDIVVKLLSQSGANFNEDNAHLRWDLNLAAGQSKTLEFSFSVKYDKSKPINLNL